MATYNAMPYLPQAVHSILQQSFSDFELLIVNDASSDRSRDYLDKVDDSRVKVIHLEKNVGPGAARNLAFSGCHCEFVSIMDADDISLPTRFAKQIAYLDAHREVGMVGTQFQYVGSQKRGFGALLPQKHDDIHQALLLGQHAIVNSSCMFRRTLLNSLLGYRFPGAGEDWDFFLRLAESSRVENLDEILLLVRVHSNSLQVTKINEARRWYSYSISCAKRRMAGLPETSFEAYEHEQLIRTPWARWVDWSSVHSLALYRQSLPLILGDEPIGGYARLLWAAIWSPSLVWQRCRRWLAAIRRRRAAEERGPA